LQKPEATAPPLDMNLNKFHPTFVFIIYFPKVQLDITPYLLKELKMAILQEACPPNSAHISFVCSP
jgi:hypothetical protein